MEKEKSEFQKQLTTTMTMIAPILGMVVVRYLGVDNPYLATQIGPMLLSIWALVSLIDFKWIGRVCWIAKIVDVFRHWFEDDSTKYDESANVFYEFCKGGSHWDDKDARVMWQLGHVAHGDSAQYIKLMSSLCHGVLDGKKRYSNWECTAIYVDKFPLQLEFEGHTITISLHFLLEPRLGKDDFVIFNKNDFVTKKNTSEGCD